MSLACPIFKVNIRVKQNIIFLLHWCVKSPLIASEGFTLHHFVAFVVVVVLLLLLLLAVVGGDVRLPGHHTYFTDCQCRFKT